MGRKRKRTQPQSKQQQQQQPGNSKQGRAQQYRRRSSGRATLYWIQDCPDLWPSGRDDDNVDEPPPGGTPAVVNPPPELLLWITASHLEDAHTVSSSSSAAAATLDPSHHQQAQKQPTTAMKDPTAVVAASSNIQQLVVDKEAQPVAMGQSSCDGGQSNDHAENATREDSNKEDPAIGQVVTGTGLDHDHVCWLARGAYRTAAEFTVKANIVCSGDVSSETMEARTADFNRTLLVEAATTALESRTEEQSEEQDSNINLPIIYILRDRKKLPIDDLSDATHHQQRQKQQQKRHCHLPHGDCGDGIRNPYSNDIVQDKYWAQRKRLFTRFDHGIQLDADGWFSVTPEAIAQHIARRMTAHTNHRHPKFVVLDAFCGVGGNTIALAQQPSVALVVAVDTNLERIRLAAHNCRVYDIPRHKVVFVHGNAWHVLSQYRDGKQLVSLATDTEEESDEDNNEVEVDENPVEKTAEPNVPANNEDEVKTTGVSISNCTEKVGYKIISGTTPRELSQLPYHNLDAIFLSPPWGGTDYEQIGPRHYTLDQGIQLPPYDNDNTTVVVNGVDLLQQSILALPPDRLNLAYFLPRNLNGLTLAQQAYECGVRGCLELEQNILNGKLKTITAYLQQSSIPGQTTGVGTAQRHSN